MKNKFHKEKQWILNEKYHGVETSEFSYDLERLEENEPVDYIIGHRPFLDCHIDLSYRPLIPREETEFWVKKALEKIHLDVQRPSEEGLEILDLFSGSGCIGIALLKHVLNCHVDFGEIDPKLIKQIHLNLEINKIPDNRTKVFLSNVFGSLVPKKYDFIFANPPYLSRNNLRNIQNSVLTHEPEKALFADEDGFELIRKTIKGASKYLKKNGKLFIEIDPDQKVKIERLEIPNLVFEFWRDQYNVVRACRAEKMKK